MKNLNHFAFAATCAVLVSAVLTGCGSFKTDPTSDYAEFKSWGKPTDQKEQDLRFIDSSVFSLQYEKGLIFVEGELGTHLFKPQLKIDGVEYTLSAEGLPDGATFAPATDAESAGQYLLSWSPKVGTLSDHEPYRPYKIKIHLNVTKTNDAQAAAVMKIISTVEEVDFNLVRTSQQPVVENVKLASNEIVIGDSVAFTVDVRDPAAPAGTSPILKIHDEKSLSQEVVTLPAAAGVTIDRTPQVLPSGEFRYSGKLDTSAMQLPKKASEGYADFVIGLTSISKLPAVEQIVKVKLLAKAAAAPAPAQSPAPVPAKATAAPAAPAKVTAPAKTAKAPEAQAKPVTTPAKPAAAPAKMPVKTTAAPVAPAAPAAAPTKPVKAASVPAAAAKKSTPKTTPRTTPKKTTKTAKATPKTASAKTSTVVAPTAVTPAAQPTTAAATPASKTDAKTEVKQGEAK